MGGLCDSDSTAHEPLSMQIFHWCALVRVLYSNEQTARPNGCLRRSLARSLACSLVGTRSFTQSRSLTHKKSVLQDFKMGVSSSRRIDRGENKWPVLNIPSPAAFQQQFILWLALSPRVRYASGLSHQPDENGQHATRNDFWRYRMHLCVQTANASSKCRNYHEDVLYVFVGFL